jgi:hypothetical protein
MNFYLNHDGLVILSRPNFEGFSAGTEDQPSTFIKYNLLIATDC